MNCIDYEKMTNVMKSKGITMYQVAESSGIRYATIYRFFKRQTKNPAFNTVAKICRAIGISIDEAVI